MPKTAALGTYVQHPSLVDALPPLVRKQRRLEAKIAAVAEDAKDEKAVRGQIDALLIAAGLQKSDLVTCAGYDIQHQERDGRASLNGEMLTARLIAEGVAPELVAQVLLDGPETGPPAIFCTVKPSKGARVRAPQTQPATLRLLSRGLATAADRKRA